MVIRNRLFAVLIRIALFSVYVTSLYFHFGNYENYALALCSFSVQIGLVLTVMTGFEIIFNLIDLRHGIHGVPAGPYMPIALPINSFSVLAGILYFSVQIPEGSAPLGTYAILFHVMLIVGPLLDWIGLDEKGTVRFAAGFTAQLYPILYFIFGYFRTVIWDESPVFNGNMYSYVFLDFTGPDIVRNAFLFFLMTLGAVSVSIFFNNMFAGKYGFLTNRRD